MALLLSMILTSIDDMGQKNMKSDFACINLQTHVEKAIKHIRFGKKLDRILFKISNEVQLQLGHIGTRFQGIYDIMEFQACGFRNMEFKVWDCKIS